MNDVPSLFLGWTALLAGVWFLFEKSESVASRETKLRIARWLKRLDLDGATSRWPTTFISLFDSVFGRRHLSWLCFFRSCVASSCVVAMVLLVWAAFHWNSVRIMTKLGPRASFVFVVLLTITTSVSLIADYVSLLKTRYILQRMRGTISFAQVVGLLALDLLATGCLALGVYAGVWWSFAFLSKATGSQSTPLSLLPLVVDTILTGNFGYLFITPPGYEGTLRVGDGIRSHSGSSPRSSHQCGRHCMPFQLQSSGWLTHSGLVFLPPGSCWTSRRNPSPRWAGSRCSS